VIWPLTTGTSDCWGKEEGGSRKDYVLPKKIESPKGEKLRSRRELRVRKAFRKERDWGKSKVSQINPSPKPGKMDESSEGRKSWENWSQEEAKGRSSNSSPGI